MIYADDGPILVLSPHLDDAILSCFRILTAGDPVVVVNLFAGVPEPGTPTGVWGRICGFDDAHDLAEARIREDGAALAKVGIEPVYLPFAESSVRSALDDPPPSVDVLLAEIEAVAPEASLVLAPLCGSDRPHPDHVLARRVALDLLYDGIPTLLYADFPHVCKARGLWPSELFDHAAEWNAAGGLQTSTTVRWSKRLPRDVPEIDPLYNSTVWFLDEAERDRKRAAMETYATQFRALDRGLRTKGIVSDPALYGVEVVVPVTPR